MSVERLSALDASFLDAETTTAHMHVGWAARFDRPPQGPAPSFEALREHITRRLHRAPRFRQRLAFVPLGIDPPVWVDDDRFDPTHHIRRAPEGDLGELADRVMSQPLDRDRPLWEVWIADALEDRRIGLVGKSHHCMVDGLADVQLALLLLDDTRQTPPPEEDDWIAEPAPTPAELAIDAMRRRATDALAVPARAVTSPGRALNALGRVPRAAAALTSALRPAPGSPTLARSISARRHLAMVARPLEELREIGTRFGVTINDVLLAATAGGLRGFLSDNGERPHPVKTMVPVALRTASEAGRLGNDLAFVFVDLPCDEPDPVRRLVTVHGAMRRHKVSGEPEGAADVLEALSHTPPLVRRALARAAASPWAFTLTVSNIPGPRPPLYLLGCELLEAYPIVPIADGHAVSVGMTTIQDTAYLGIYVDPAALPDSDDLAEAIGDAMDELAGCAERRAPSTHEPRLPVPG